jgi:S1-C subfamily serine protease
MNWFDLIVVLVALAAAVGGYRLGFLARAASWIGLGLGLYICARFLPRIMNALKLANPASVLLVAALVLIGGAFTGQALGLLVGARLHRALPPGPIREVDRGVGAGVGAVGVVVVVWLLLPSMANMPGWPARAARTSSIASWVDTHFPKPPDALQALGRLVGKDNFPQVFNSLHQGEAVGPPPQSAALAAGVQERVTASTVKVEGDACSRIQEGSGFTVGPNEVATNAHVVAGEGRNHTRVKLLNGTVLPATVVLFDPNRDLALLRVNRLTESPLPTAPGFVGETGAVFGHPGGVDNLIVAPAMIAQNVTAVGLDLYSSHNIRRDVFIMSAQLRPGDSGGPLVNTSGAVVGVAFAIAPDQPNTSYALTSKELNAVLAQPLSGPVSTGPCLND